VVVKRFANRTDLAGDVGTLTGPPDASRRVTVDRRALDVPEPLDRRGLRVLAVGASITAVCGLRDYHRILQESLRSLGSVVETIWWERTGRTDPRTSVPEARQWLAQIRSAAAQFTPDALVWHYTPFAYGHRGVPYLVPYVSRRLARVGPPAIPILHELISLWGPRGAKGALHAMTTRAVLPDVLRFARGVVVTTEDRRDWLGRSWWLPRRPMALAPVFSNVPVVGRTRPAPGSAGHVPVIGVFGYTFDGIRDDVATAALALLRARGRSVRLVLIGSPGAVGPGPERWRESARRHGIPEPEFTGVLEPADLSARLSALDILLLPDEAGPASRKGTLAAGLAHGLPIVAFQTPTAWRSLVREQAVALAPAMPERLADTLEDLLRDDSARAALGTRAAAFYAAHLDPLAIGGDLLAFVRRLRAGRC
jgi:glycosyltransferase involved in cell wall biosynthesis